MKKVKVTIMSLNKKRLIAGLIALAFTIAYPLTSSSKSNAKDNLTLSQGNMVSINGEINVDSVSDAIYKLRKLDAKYGTDPIYLFLYTPGGDIQAGLELIEAVHGMHHPVHTITLFAASMGFNLVQNLGDRYILKNGILMAHRASGGFEGSFGGDSPSQIDSRYTFWLQRIKELDEQTVKRTNGKQTLESFRHSYSPELWMTGQAAIDQGYSDMMVTVRCDSSLDGNESHETSFLGTPVHYEFSRCPLITSPQNVRVGLADAKNNDPLTKMVLEEIKNKFIEQYKLETKLH